MINSSSVRRRDVPEIAVGANLCPECGNAVAHMDGCSHCTCCGYGSCA